MSKLAICAALVCAATVIAQSPQLLRDVNATPGAGANPTINGPSPRTGELFFVADDGVHGSELWSTDGSALGTAMVLDMSPGAASTTHWDAAVAGSRGVLMVERSNVWELWSTDGTGAGTTMLLSASAIGAGVFQREFEELAPGVWAFGVDGVMWRTDGTAAGTFSLGLAFTFGSVVGEVAGLKLLQLINGDVVLTDGTNLLTIANVPGRVHQGPDGRWYSFQNTGSGMSPQTLVTWLDGPGSPSFTVLGFLPTIQLIDGGALIIENQDDLKLWTGAGWPTTVVGLQAISGFLAVGDEWAFVATDAAHGRELWLTDGTLAGTRVADLAAGPASSDPGLVSGLPTGLLVWADVGAIGREPWHVDPATLVATSLGDLEPGAGGSDAWGLTPLAGGQRRSLLAFYAPSTGAELAISDGTAGGTQVFDIVPGPQGSVQNQQNLDGMAGPAGGAVVWFSDDGVNGVEPWVMQLPGSSRLERDYGPADLLASDPVLGGSLDVALSKMAPGQLGVVALGLPVAVGPALLPGRHLHFDPLTAIVLTIAVPGSSGSWAGSFPLPNQPSAVGLDAVLQPVFVSTSSPLVLDVGPAWWLSFGF
ncbi:MAG: ELWxxDGT repeat protein [Planctomycetota bacterium]|jgi:ELWxxDGT repeat protein